ncbi:hypothetical protein L596_027436 [Steinernema carpocapsae]|uniref:Peptidase A1 domain-containing protein n=1 Tax=Steinernema carpocapsae TaxID=34508 RepID=A0A4U5M4B9_STECR|nr:hypothetical protein L596_027436 [Steinernema carpocapsae]
MVHSCLHPLFLLFFIFASADASHAESSVRDTWTSELLRNGDELKGISWKVDVGSPPQRGRFLISTVDFYIRVNVCPRHGPSMSCFKSTDSTTFKIGKYLRTASDMLKPVMMHLNPNVTFNTNFTSNTFMGVIGISPSRFLVSETEPLEWLFPNGRKRIFSVALNNYDWGIMEFGGSVCSNETAALVSTTSRKYWQFTIDGIEVGPVILNARSQFVVSTQHTSIGMPREFLKDMERLHIKYNDNYKAYFINCTRAHRLPDFTVFLQTKSTLNIPGYMLVDTANPVENGQCKVKVEDSNAKGIGPEWYAGVPLLQTYCITFDYENKHMVFSPNHFYYHD